MPLPSPYRNPGRWRAVVFQREVRHGTAGCLLSLVLLAPLLVRTWGLGRVVAAVLLYSCLLVPALTNYFSASRLFLRLLRSIQNVASPPRSTFYTSLTVSLGSAVSRAAYWVGAFVRQVLRCLLKAITMPFVFIFGCVVPVLHAVYLAFDGFRITSNQTRQWVRLVETTRLREDVARLTAWYVAARLGKGVAMSFVLVMFTLQFNHVEPDLLYMAVTFLYFVITQRKWTGNERIVSFIRALRLDLLEEEEEFWVPLLLRGVPLAASACTAVLLAAASSPRLVVVAAYTNLLVPGQLLRQEYMTHATQHIVLSTKCSRATPQEASSHSPCPVCLEDLRQARVTPCGHYYHVACLRRCLLMSPLCPLCKQVI
ncbi:uncharacterized protein [Panulirus ornatus]|uniref:uncharacterized protein isoform X3 n=1 Tax=Panulirus ornatus TaxID=150431 RepID=UPI003A84D095